MVTTSHNQPSSLSDDDLERDFAELRGDQPPVSDAFMARILDDAFTHIPAPAPIPATAPDMITRLRQLLAFGRWQSGMGLAASALAGIWIGYAAPVGLSTLITPTTPLEVENQSVDADPFDTFLLEG